MNQTVAGVFRLLSPIHLCLADPVLIADLNRQIEEIPAIGCHGLLFRKEAEHCAVSGRLQDACFQLRHSDRSIDEIMDLLGITGRGYFFSLFRQETGMTPKQYRTKFRQ